MLEFISYIPNCECSIDARSLYWELLFSPKKNTTMPNSLQKKAKRLCDCKKSSEALINLLVWCSSMLNVLYAGCCECLQCFLVITKACLIVESWCFGELMMVINYMSSWLWVFAKQTEHGIIGNSLWRSRKTCFKYSKNFPSLFQGHLMSLICPQAKEDRS